MSDTIHLWAILSKEPKTRCGRYVTEPTNVLWASTAESLKIPPNRVCKVCYRLGPQWLVVVK